MYGPQSGISSCRFIAFKEEEERKAPRPVATPSFAAPVLAKSGRSPDGGSDAQGVDQLIQFVRHSACTEAWVGGSQLSTLNIQHHAGWPTAQGPSPHFGFSSSVRSLNHSGGLFYVAPVLRPPAGTSCEMARARPIPKTDTRPGEDGAC